MYRYALTHGSEHMPTDYYAVHPFSVAVRGQGVTGVMDFAELSRFDAGLEKYIPGYSGWSTVPVNVEAYVSTRFSSGAGAGGFLDSSTWGTASITYFYSVPDEGSTAILLGLGLLTLRRLKCRR